MTRYLAAVVVWAGAAGLAAAQPPTPPGGLPAQRPAYSPYLNLLRPGASTLQNYYGLVRPQQQAIATANQFQQQFGAVNQQLNALTAFATSPDQFTTAAPFGYFTHRAYFMNLGGGGGNGGVGSFGTGIGQRTNGGGMAGGGVAGRAGTGAGASRGGRR